MMKFGSHTRIVLALVILQVASFAGIAQDKAAQIDALLNAYHRRDEFNGAALVAEHGRIILQKGYGLANREWGIPNTPETKFRPGSITKQFTAMLVLQLAAEGRLRLDGTISDYLPYYRKDTGSRVTLHHLLTHTSGIPSYTNREWIERGLFRHPHAVKEHVEKFCSGDLEFEPGSTFKYSNSGYVIPGAILEAVSGKTYEQLLEEKILDPLGMKDTGYDHQETVLLKRAAGYVKTGRGYQNAPFVDMSNPYAAGALYSTVGNLYRWDRALYTDELLPQQWRKKCFTPFLNHYGYGWIILDLPMGGTRRRVVQHGGRIFGFSSWIQRWVDEEHLIVLLDNTSRGKISRRISEILYGLNKEATSTQEFIDEGDAGEKGMRWRCSRGEISPHSSGHSGVEEGASHFRNPL